VVVLSLVWCYLAIHRAGVLRQVGATGVLKKSASADSTARELAGRSPSASVAGERPARASRTWAADGPAALPLLAEHLD
jgi:hypothetical protein